jgi:hypothetical protein
MSERKMTLLALRAPFDPEDVKFRPGAAVRDKVMALAYVSSRAVMDRLDDAVGPENWSFRYEPLAIGVDTMRLAKGILTIYGVSKEDIGEASNTSPSKGTVADALKRAAVQWGIGRYLYDHVTGLVTLDGKRISNADLARLRAKLPRPGDRVRDPDDDDEETDETSAPATRTTRLADPPESAPTPPRTDAQRAEIAKRNRDLGKELGLVDKPKGEQIYTKAYCQFLGKTYVEGERPLSTDEEVDDWTAHLTDRIAERDAVVEANRKRLEAQGVDVWTPEDGAPLPAPEKLSFPPKGAKIDNDLRTVGAGGRPN